MMISANQNLIFLRLRSMRQELYPIVLCSQTAIESAPEQWLRSSRLGNDRGISIMASLPSNATSTWESDAEKPFNDASINAPMLRRHKKGCEITSEACTPAVQNFGWQIPRTPFTCTPSERPFQALLHLARLQLHLVLNL